MNKNDLINNLSAASGISKVQAKSALQALLHELSSSLKRGEKVSLKGFGSFSVATRAAREGRNPGTGVKLAIRATKVAKFKAGKELRSSLK